MKPFLHISVIALLMTVCHACKRNDPEPTEEPTTTSRPYPITTMTTTSVPDTTMPPPSPTRCSDIYPSVQADGTAAVIGSKWPSAGLTSRYIIVLKNRVDPDEFVLELQLRFSGLHPVDVLRGSLPCVVIDLDDKQVDTIRKLSMVKYIEHDSEEFMTDTEASVTWGLDRVDQRQLPLDGVYQVYGDGKDVPVYVIDSGINVDHEDFGGRAVNWFDATGENGVDCSGHGTHCAGTVGSEHYGVAPGVMLFSLRVFNCEGKGYKSMTIRAMNEVLVNGSAPGVVSMSLGGSASPSQDEMVKILFEAGFVVVVAAGNNNDDACLKSPARAYEAITVGATNINDTRAYFSNYGIGVNMFAPGRYIESLDYATNNGTSIKSGTSMATPHVSGLAAILISKGTLAEDVPEGIYNLTTKDIVRDAGEYSYNRFMYVPNE